MQSKGTDSKKQKVRTTHSKNPDKRVKFTVYDILESNILATGDVRTKFIMTAPVQLPKNQKFLLKGKHSGRRLT